MYVCNLFSLKCITTILLTLAFSSIFVLGQQFFPLKAIKSELSTSKYMQKTNRSRIGCRMVTLRLGTTPGDYTEVEAEIWRLSGANAVKTGWKYIHWLMKHTNCAAAANHTWPGSQVGIPSNFNPTDFTAICCSLALALYFPDNAANGRSHQLLLLTIIGTCINNAAGKSCQGSGLSCAADGSIQYCQAGTLRLFSRCPAGLTCSTAGGSAHCDWATGGGGSGGGGGSKPGGGSGTGGKKDSGEGGGGGGTSGGGGGGSGSGGGGGGGGSGEAFCTEAEFGAAVTGLGFPKPSHDQYKNCVSQARSAGGITSKREFAMFFTQILWESGGLQYKEEIACKQTKCPGSYKTANDCPGKYYYGRGYIQLSWHYNYKAASEALFGDDRLVCNPDLVASDDSVAWGTAFWYWKANVHNAPGVQQGQFGASTNAINGALECRGAYRHKAAKRFQNYKKVLKALHINEAANSAGC